MLATRYTLKVNLEIQAEEYDTQNPNNYRTDYNNRFSITDSVSLGTMPFDKLMQLMAGLHKSIKKLSKGTKNVAS